MIGCLQSGNRWQVVWCRFDMHCREERVDSELGFLKQLLKNLLLDYLNMMQTSKLSFLQISQAIWIFLSLISSFTYFAPFEKVWMCAQCVCPLMRGMGWGWPAVERAEVRAQRRCRVGSCCRCLSRLLYSGQERAMAGCSVEPGRLTWLLSGVGWAEAAGRPGPSSQEQHVLVAGGPGDGGHICSCIPFTCLALAAGSPGYCLWCWHCFTPG